jgi:diguanylate cyclase (GGDEF)-like protein/PAS domain S-box-containing protein
MAFDRVAEFAGLPAEFAAALKLAAAAVGSGDAAIISQRLDGTIMSWDAAAERLYGWAAADTVGNNIEMIVPEAYREELSTIIARLSEGPVEHFESGLTHKYGFDVRVMTTISPVYSSGRVVGAVFAAEAMTVPQRPEVFQAQLTSIVESAEDAIISLDTNGRVITWNDSAERLYGYTAAEMLGRTYGEIMQGGPLDDFTRLFRRAMAGERISHYETTRPRRDGSTMEVSVSLSPIFTPDGQIVGESAVIHDITERKRRERELAASLELLERAQRVGRIGGWTAGVGPDAPLTCTSETFRIFGTGERSDLTTADFYELVHPDDLERVRAAVQEAISQAGRYELEHRIVRPDGSEGWVFEAADVVADEDGNPVEMTGVVQDITERHEAEEQIRKVERRLTLLVENARDVIFQYRLEPEPAFEFVSPASLSITGYTPEELYDDPALIDRVVDSASRELWLERLASGQNEVAGDLELVRKDGSTVWVSQRLTAVRDSAGQLIAMDGITRDIADRKVAELRLEHEALHDSLTGLPNRALLMDRIAHGLSRAERRNGLVAVLFVDLDRFKLFNDAQGHGRGDAVLSAVAQRLVESSRAADTVGRFSSDEFVIVCESLRTAADAIKIAEHTLAAFSTPFDVGGEAVFVKASIGIATGHPAEAGQSAERLLRDADLAMYRAKDRGRARYEVFDDTLQEEAERRSVVEAGLRRALDHDELGLVFQPVWSIAEECFVGAEALIRWNDPERGTISPADFIPVAEDCGLIVPIGAWVLEQAFASLARWKEMGPRQAACTMSVNVSAVQLRSPTFPEQLEQLIAETGVEPRRLCLEITESVLMADIEYFSGALHRLRALGARLSVDDFGTGYSSLAYLRRFPIDELKIDQSFVEGLGHDAMDAALVAAVIGIGDALGLRIVAEGVEHAEQLAVLSDLGCRYAQGYFFARPCDFDACSALLGGDGPR